MEVIIKGTKSELMELLAEIRRKDKEYITIPYYPTNPYYPNITYADRTSPLKTITRPEDIKTTTADINGDLYERR